MERLLSDWELVSVYLNGDPRRLPEEEAALVAEFAARGLPLPERPSAPPPALDRRKAMSPETFLSYLLLIYTLSGLFYAWLYLPERILRQDFRKDLRHHLIQTGIALAYQAAEVVAFAAIVF